jgi:hypothetical protein
VIDGLPGGAYQVVALEYLEPGEEQDPDTLDRLRGLGTSVTVKEGRRKPSACADGGSAPSRIARLADRARGALSVSHEE